MKEWLLIFMFLSSKGWVPESSGPHELEVCLALAKEQTERSGYIAHCKRGLHDRRYPK